MVDFAFVIPVRLLTGVNFVDLTSCASMPSQKRGRASTKDFS